MRQSQYQKAEINQNADNEAQDKLSLKPKTDLSATPTPEANDVFMAFDRSDDTKKIDHTVFLDRQIEGENDGEEKRKGATKYDCGCVESIARCTGDIILECGDQIMQRDRLAGDRDEALHRRPEVLDIDGIRHHREIVDCFI